MAERFQPETADGWHLDLSVHRTDRFDPSLRPVMFVPGYGMNSFILDFHPSGPSFVRALCDAGFEVWCANLRGQGDSKRRVRGAPAPALRVLAEEDLATSIDVALQNTATSRDEIDLIGCSLGGSLAFAYLALVNSPRVGSLVTIGAPLRWVDVPGLLRLVFSSRTVAGALRISGSRRMATMAMPFVKKNPWVLSLYANAENVDMDHVDAMMQTVEDPTPRTNRDIASWLKKRDMVLRGINVSHAMTHQKGPLLLIAANRDGIVPESTALSARHLWGGDVSVLRIGTPRQWYAHADIFVGRQAPELVFAPVGDWLRAKNERG